MMMQRKKERTGILYYTVDTCRKRCFRKETAFLFRDVTWLPYQLALSPFFSYIGILPADS